MTREIVVTGTGVVSPIGLGKTAYWDALFQGTVGLRPITLFHADWSSPTAGEISNFDALPYLGKKGLRDLDRSARLLCTAARFALEDGGLQPDGEAAAALGVSVGATFGSLHSISQFDRSGLIEGPRSVNPSHFPNTVLNSPASQVSIRFRIKGFNTTVSTGWCAGLDAFCYAADLVRMGRSEAALAGGVEELCEETCLALHGLDWLSGTGGDSVRCCPFDARRNGLVPGEGAAFLMLEEREHAAKRGARIAARVLGWSSAFDPLSSASFAEAGQGLEAAIRNALEQASLAPQGIDCIFSSANSSIGLDVMEARVINRVFRDLAHPVPVTAIKSMLGETCSASGALALAAAVGCLEKDMIPPTANYHDRDPECGVAVVREHMPLQGPGNVLVLAADPYGPNAAVILGRSGRQ